MHPLRWHRRQPLAPSHLKVVSRIFRTWLAAPGPGSRGDGTSHLLVLQQLDVQISFGRPRRAGDVAQPCGGEVERGLTVRERAHDTRAPPDLAQDALERVVGANPPPVLLREGVVVSVSSTAVSTSSAARLRRRPRSFSITRLAFSRAAARSSLAWIALSMAAISRTLVEGTWLKMLRYQCTTHLCQAASRKNSGTLGKPNAGIRGDQPDTLQS